MQEARIPFVMQALPVVVLGASLAVMMGKQRELYVAPPYNAYRTAAADDYSTNDDTKSDDDEQNRIVNRLRALLEFTSRLRQFADSR